MKLGEAQELSEAVDAAWRGSGADESLQYSYFSDGYWQPKPRSLPVPGSSFAPALALFEG